MVERVKNNAQLGL